nr:hypothetical protein [uncultured Mediterranean phage uvMED]BAR15179.1 hypothetical protein [uncultured Mediterranean phage uvMED]BAR15198.1 hypothetical protein [uncultured Mediterranean phage uvMED]BAR15213.1 hypothetical protein [uncultured Mediterranean phage uvMED]BAR15232.1 hypothetical protein [uncultured Mediterranean phage uvMED]
MPKIPTFQARGQITTEAPSVRTGIQISPTATPAAALVKPVTEIAEYYEREKMIADKAEAEKQYLELSIELDEIENNAGKLFNPTEAQSTFDSQSTFLVKQKLDQSKNKRVKKMMSDLFNQDIIVRKNNVKKKSREELDKQEEYNYNTKYEISLSKYKLASSQEEKDFYQNQMFLNQESRSLYFKDSESTKNIAIDNIKKDLLVTDVEQLIENNQFESAKNILEDVDNTPFLDADKREDLLNKTKEQTNVSLYYEGFKTGNDYLVGADEDNADTLKSIEEMSMRENYFNKEGKPKNDAELFLGVDKSFKNVGRLSPSYKQILKQGVLSSPANGLPTPQIVRALRIADAADQSGRLDEYTTGEELKFYRSYLVARRILGKTESEAYEMAVKSKDVALKLSSLPQYRRKRETTFKEIRKTYSDIKSTNLTEILSYGESLYDLYVGLGSSPNEARIQITKDLKNDIKVIDDYGYLKRDINPYKSIGGLEEIKPTKEFIINKYLPDEDPDDFYLTYTGAGEFAIYNRDVPHTYYNDEGVPMLFTYENMVSFKEQIKIKSKGKTKEKLGKKQESFIEQLEKTKPFLKTIP